MGEDGIEKAIEETNSSQQSSSERRNRTEYGPNTITNASSSSCLSDSTHSQLRQENLTKSENSGRRERVQGTTPKDTVDSTSGDEGFRQIVAVQEVGNDTFKQFIFQGSHGFEKIQNTMVALPAYEHVGATKSHQPSQSSAEEIDSPTISLLGIGWRDLYYNMAAILAGFRNQNGLHHITVHQFLRLNTDRHGSFTAFSGIGAHSNLPIRIDDQPDGSVKVTVSNLELQFEAGAVEELTGMKRCTSSSSSRAEDMVKVFVGEHWNREDMLCGYIGGDESMEDENGNTITKPTYRKKFGVYPQYRIRLNGVKWWTHYSSGEESDTDISSTGLQRGSRKYKNKRQKNESSPSYLSSSVDEGDDEESEPVVVHVVSTKKRKLLKKRKFLFEDIDTTASEASDVGSLTDCSLCLSDS